MCSIFNNKINVTIFTLQISNNTENSIDDFIKEFGNIPKYLELDTVGGEYIYLFCIDSSINYMEIIEKYNYKYCYYNDKIKIQKKKYNNKYQITIN